MSVSKTALYKRVGTAFLPLCPSGGFREIDESFGELCAVQERTLNLRAYSYAVS
jgi:hypothetical protein